MVFNSNGKTYLNQFTYNNVDLETVANYCYLGMVLKFNGNFNLAINTPILHLKIQIHLKKLHIKFIKEILGIHCKASNDGCRAELNRTPLKSKIYFQYLTL